jgi:hypothetical protein
MVIHALSGLACVAIGLTAVAGLVLLVRKGLTWDGPKGFALSAGRERTGASGEVEYVVRGMWAVREYLPGNASAVYEHILNISVTRNSLTLSGPFGLGREGFSLSDVSFKRAAPHTGESATIHIRKANSKFSSRVLVPDSVVAGIQAWLEGQPSKGDQERGPAERPTW